MRVYRIRFRERQWNQLAPEVAEVTGYGMHQSFMRVFNDPQYKPKVKETTNLPPELLNGVAVPKHYEVKGNPILKYAGAQRRIGRRFL